MRALFRADAVSGYEAFHLPVTWAAGRPFGVKEESEHFGSGWGQITYDDAVADWEVFAREGNPNAMSNLAVMYTLGLDVAPPRPAHRNSTAPRRIESRLWRRRTSGSHTPCAGA